jgi:tRNA(Ile)-lysidine synthase
MDLLLRFNIFIEKERLFSKQDGLLIAVSGGVDSVVLCHLCKLAGYRFAIAHCNFGLRGEESYRDETFVQALASQLEVPFYLKRFDTKAFAEEQKLSIQVAARELRYQWFHEIINGQWPLDKEHPLASTDDSPLTTHHSRSITYHLPLSFIATAHHLDDNIETLLINLFKGTGISGLHGILPKSDKVVRPLLFATREEVQAFTQEHQLNWVEDSSNAETKYTRNYVRHEILPGIVKAFPTVKQNLSDSIQRLREAETLYFQAVQLHKKKLLECKGEEVYIPVLKLERSNPLATIVYEIIKDYGFSPQQVPEVLKLLASESGRYIISTTHRILRNRAWLIISPLPKVEETVLVIEEGMSHQGFAGRMLHFKTLPFNQVSIETNSFIALLDKNKVQFPLLLRKWKEGDYFYPLGMPKKKKLARFFIDQKLSQIQKENVWVLESNKRIIWVVGYRIDDRFKIASGTKEVLRIDLK